MPLRFLLDEHLRGPLWRALLQHNARARLFLDVVRVGDLPDLPLGSLDPEVLCWAETTSRILVTEDHTTLPDYLKAHLQAGRHVPGVLALRPSITVSAAIASLELIAHAGTEDDFRDQLVWIP